MICTNCGAQIRDGVQFCPNCGSKQNATASAGAQANQAAQTPQPQVQTYQQQAKAYGEAGQKVTDTRTMGLIGLIVGVAGIIFDFVFMPIGIILGIAAIVVSGLAMSRNKGGQNGMAIGGLVCGIVALAIGLPLCVCGAAICTVGLAGAL